MKSEEGEKNDVGKKKGQQNKKKERRKGGGGGEEDRMKTKEKKKEKRVGISIILTKGLAVLGLNPVNWYI